MKGDLLFVSLFAGVVARKGAFARAARLFPFDRDDPGNDFFFKHMTKSAKILPILLCAAPPSAVYWCRYEKRRNPS